MMGKLHKRGPKVTVIPFKKPPQKSNPPLDPRANSRWWFLLVIPAFMSGSLAGMVFLGILPGIVATELWYGSKAYMHPDIIGYLMRPGILLGGVLAVLGTIRFISKADFRDYF